MTNPEHHSVVYESANAGIFEVPTLPSWFHEPGIEDTYRPWQHTPLAPYSDQVRGHQAELREVFERLADTPPSHLAHQGLELLVRLDFMSGMAVRETQCAANFHDWVDNHPDELAALREDPDMEWLIGEGLAGHGSARGQLEILRRAPSLRSLDLQVLSTPFGYRYQHIEAMHQELREALQMVGATIYEELQWLDGHPPKIAVDPSRPLHGSTDSHGLLVTYKRKVAELADPMHSDSTIEVLERESWLLPTGAESGFSQDIAQSLHREPSWQRTKPGLAAQVQRYVLRRIEARQGSIPLGVATYAKRTEVDIA